MPREVFVVVLPSGPKLSHPDAWSSLGRGDHPRLTTEQPNPAAASPTVSNHRRAPSIPGDRAGSAWGAAAPDGQGTRSSAGVRRLLRARRSSGDRRTSALASPRRVRRCARTRIQHANWPCVARNRRAGRTGCSRPHQSGSGIWSGSTGGNGCSSRSTMATESASTARSRVFGSRIDRPRRAKAGAERIAAETEAGLSSITRV